MFEELNYKLLKFLIIGIIVFPFTRLSAQFNPDSLYQLTYTESSYPSWSPDGTKIVFHSNRNGNADIYTMNIDGSNLKQLGVI
jgi:hypothetical protein